mgnify:CR=1 FL=1
MLASDCDDIRVNRICNSLNEHEKPKVHSCYFDLECCIEIDLKVKRLEDDQNLQDLVRSVHHVCMHTFSNTKTVKMRIKMERLL